MSRNNKIPLVLTVLALALAGCSSNKVKVEEVKPNPLPKITQSTSLAPVFSQSVSSTSDKDSLRLQLDVDNGVIFSVDPKGTVSAYRGKQKLWQKQVTKEGLTAGVEAAAGTLIVGNEKGQLFALNQENGEQKWTAQLSSAILAPSLIMGDRVITIANDGTVFAHNVDTGLQLWTYDLPSLQFSLRGTASPVALDQRNVVIASANAYVYVLDTLTGTPQLQRRVAVSDGRSDVQKLNDLSDPVVAGQFIVTTSYQGQVTVLDLASQQVIWSENLSSTKRPEVAGNGVFVSSADGKIVAYEITSGHKLWENDRLLNRKLSNPAMLGDQLIVGDLDGYLHILNPSTGEIIGRSKTSGEVRSLRVVDNQLYVSTQKGALTVWQNR